MLRFKSIPMSIDDPKLNDKLILDAFEQIKSLDYRIPFYYDLCTTSPNGYSFLIAYDDLVFEKNKLIDIENTCHDLFTVTIHTSQSSKSTEDIINDVLFSLTERGDCNFINIFNPMENIYILLLENNKEGFIPRVLITPASTFSCSSRSGHLSERLEEIREECGRLPYDSILIDNNYIMFLI